MHAYILVWYNCTELYLLAVIVIESHFYHIRCWMLFMLQKANCMNVVQKIFN